MWHPALPSGDGPLYARLADAMERDVASGALSGGTRLPPHRDLAHALKISVGSVTRAYAEADRRGLLSAHVGRGTYVRAPSTTIPFVQGSRRDGGSFQRGTAIDLCRNAPPAVVLGSVRVADALARTVAALGRDDALGPAASYSPGTGLEVIRAAGARWIARRLGLDRAADDLIQCNGGQHALALVFSSLCRPGDTILCESSTYYGARTAADHLGRKLHGVAMDADGLLPDALERAATETRAKLLFTVPTLHNPTTRTMSATRRAEIAAVARRHDLTILEDDAYYAYTDPACRPPQIASFAPERTLYVASISKGLFPGFRLAFMSVPAGLAQDRLMRGIRALSYSPPALSGLVFARWVEDGTADAVADAVQAEIGGRLDMARTMLGDALAPPGAIRTPHVWLPMPAIEAERVLVRALRGGVEITPPDVSSVSEDADTGLRLCLGAPDDRAALAKALAIVGQALTGNGLRNSEGII